MSAARALRAVAAFAVLVALHYAVRPLLGWRVMMDFLVIAVLLMAVRVRPAFAALLGFATGLIADALSPTALGAGALAMTLIGFAASWLKAVFFEALDATIGDYERIATIVPSESDQEEYAWLGAVPSMREFKDERMPLGLLEHSYATRNKTWESSIAVERAAIEDDKLGQIKLRVMSLAREAKRHMDQTDLMVYEIAFRVGFDDQHYFSKTFKKYAGVTPSEYRGKQP
jgi:uncharacterized membrane protein YeaQ/YmgE (transglycosylase-associated protein family)